MEFQTLQQSILIMAVIIGIGSLIGYRQPLTADSRQLVITIIINVAMPCIILDGIFQTAIDSQILTQIFVIFLVSVLLNCLGILLGRVRCRFLRKNGGSWPFCPVWAIPDLSDFLFAQLCSVQKERCLQRFLTPALISSCGRSGS
jgi:predicted permease